MTQWEQIKKEYRDIPVPVDGPHQMMEAIAKAKRKRNRLQSLTKYATVVAAILVVVLLVPGIGLFFGGFATSEDAAMESEKAVQKNDADGGWNAYEDGKNGTMTPVTDSVNDADNTSGRGKTAEETPEYSPEDTEEECQEDKASGVVQKGFTVPAEYVEAVSKEVLRQMEERMKQQGETYYIKSETYPDGFSLITDEQSFAVNADGLLVITFPAGSVAPFEQGAAEFVIPAEVFQP